MYVSDILTDLPAADHSEKEQAVYALLQQLEIPYERVDHEAAMTMEACRAADEAMGTKMCKNLVLCHRQQTDF